MKKLFVITGLMEVPIKDGYGDERNYILSVHIDTVEGINTAEEIASENADKYDHGVEIKTVFYKIK